MLYLKKMIAMLLCISVSLGIAQVKTAASEVTAHSETLQATDTVFSEVIALREENVKHFDIGNGRYQAIAYSHPVHELDADGKWQDIDFGLTLKNVRGTNKYVSASSGTSFAANYSANQPLITLENNNYAVSMALVDTSAVSATRIDAKTPVAAKVTNPKNDFRTVNGANNATFSSKVLYEEVLPGVDLEYIVDPGTVKENIIVKKQLDSYEYVFSLKLTGLYPSMKDDGSIVLYDLESDAKRYEIPAPFMYDALGNISKAVSYTLNGSGSAYTLTVTADKQWINETGRSFPVTIDPTYVVSTESADDTYIYSGYSSGNYGSSSDLWVSSECITFIQTPRPNIPNNMKLYWAALVVFYYYYDHVTSGYVDVSAHRVMHYWNESALTWDQAADFPGYYGLEETAQSTAAAYGHLGATVNDPEQMVFSVSDLARSWADLEYANLGVGLKYRSISTNGSVLFKSYESSYNYRPRLTYYYGSRVYEIKHFYDMSMSNANIQQISEVMEVASEICTNELAVSIYDEGAPVYKGVYTDICRAGRDQSCKDVCSTPHHKDIHYLSGMFSGEVHSSNERAVFWTDRPLETYCQHINNSCYPIYSLKPTFAMTVVDSNVIQILNIYPDDNANKDLACMGMLFLHELAHTWGLDERYESYNHEQEGTQCVMEGYNMHDPIEATSFFESFRHGECDAFCSGCFADLADSLPN